MYFSNNCFKDKSEIYSSIEKFFIIDNKRKSLNLKKRVSESLVVLKKLGVVVKEARKYRLNENSKIYQNLSR